MYKRPVKVFFILAGAFPLLGLLQKPPQFMLLIVTVFVAALFARSAIRRRAASLRFRPSVQFWLFTVASGLLAEVLAWSGHYAAGSKDPALLHPQLIPDLLLGLGFYSGWAIAWLMVSRFSAFSFRGVFWTTGLLGVFFEQMGAVFKTIVSSLASNPLVSIGMAVFVWATYGSIMGLGYLPVSPAIGKGRPSRWFAYPAAFVLMFLLSSLLTTVAGIVFGALGMVPDKKPISQFPFW